MATIILTAVGTALGGPVGGMIGAMAGNAIDHAVLFKPKGREGPRIADLNVQTSSYGSQLPYIFGRMRVAGTVIWATDLRETRTKHGGGKGRPSTTTYSYSASFAVALSARRIESVGRIWADGNLLRGSAGDFKSGIGAFRVHPGGEDQAVDPLIAAAQGVGVTPAHRGVAYAVLEDLALEDFGNRIPSLTFEVIAEAGEVAVRSVAGALLGEAVAGGAEAVQGYAASGGDAGMALRPLLEAHGLAVRAGSDGFALAGRGESEGTVPHASQARRLNGRLVEPARHRRAAAETVPVRLSLRHYEPARDYQAGVQKAARPGVGWREETIDLPAVLAAGEARALAGARLSDAWAGRERLELICGWDRLSQAPGAIVGVEGHGGLWRVEESEWEAMGVRLALRRVPGGTAETLPASSGEAVLPPDAPHGATVIRIVDLPPLGEAPASLPMVAVAAGGDSSGWRRAALFTLEPSTGAAVAAGGTAPAALMGTVVTPPAAEGTAMLFDAADSLVVALLNEARAPEAADDAELGRGANLCLVGRELIQFGAVEEIGAGLYRLSRLLRGRRGTEWAMAGHVAGEPFLLVEAERLAPVPDAAVQVGSTLDMIAIGIGDAVPAEASCAISGEALIPPEPVHLSLEEAGGDRIVRWTRRSRAGWRWSDGVDAPLGEESERYALRLMDGSVLLRTAETSVPLWTYGAAEAAADVAAGHMGPLSLEVRQVGTHALGRAATLVI